MKIMYGLIKVETQGIPKENQVREIVFVSEKYTSCLGKFLSLSGFSFTNNNKFSYTQYFIEEVVKVCSSCNTTLLSDQLIEDNVLTVCGECGATENFKFKECVEEQKSINN